MLARSLGVTIVMVLLCVLISWKEAVAGGYVYRTRYIEIYYSSQQQLRDFEDEIKPDAFTRTVNQIFVGSDDSSAAGSLGAFVDQLFKRVQMTLDMPVPRLRLKIQVFTSQSEITRAYRQLSGDRHTAPPAFYTKKNNTIYVHTERVHIGMLAHEMAHAVIDNFFVIRPPEKVAEMLCQYVDREISGR